MIRANYDGIQHRLPYREHRGPDVDVAAVIAAQDKARAKEWRPDFSGNVRFYYLMLLVLLAGAALPACVSNTVLNPDLLTPDDGPTIGPATPDSAPTLVVTPGAPATEVVVNMPIANFGVKAPPDYIVGGIENMGLPTGSEATAWDGGLFKSVTLHGLVPVLDGGVAVNYIGADGLSYAPGLDELGDPSFAILRPNGEVDQSGIREYVANDGLITRYVRAGLPCPDGSVCMQVVSYNPEDASVLYWVRVDEQTGEILGYLPAVSDERPTSGAQFTSAEGKWESKPLTGSTALSVGEAVGVSYDSEVNGEPIFIFTVGEDVVQANDDEIFYSPASETLWVQSDEGLFVSDSETGNWAQAKEVPGEAKIYEVEGKEFVLSLGQLLWVNEITAGADVPSLTTTDGRKLSWINGEWVAAPESATSTSESLTCYKPEDVATWCANLEAKDPHAMWQMAINAMIDGPANADYWAETLGKANPTHAEKLNWLKNSTHTDANGNEAGYWLPAQSPDGTDFLWLSANNGQAKYAEFNINKGVQSAGGVSVKDIGMVVLTPDAFNANKGGIKDWWRAVIDANRGSYPIFGGVKSIYTPQEVYGLVVVEGKLVFVGGSPNLGEPLPKYKPRMIVGSGENAIRVFGAMFDTFLRAMTQFTESDLNLNNPDGINPPMSIALTADSNDAYPTDPVDLKEEEMLLRVAK